MICEKCSLDKDEKDFIKGQKECYKCRYKEKLKNCKSKKRIRLCRECYQPIPKEKNKISRRVYCSEKCAFIGHKKQNNEFWTKNINLMEDGRTFNKLHDGILTKGIGSFKTWKTKQEI